MTEREDRHRAEVLRLHYLEGASVRRIARDLGLSRKTVRRILGTAPAKTKQPVPRTKILDRYRDAVRQMLSASPEMRATGVLERLRATGFDGGITVVRDLVRELRPHAVREPFLTLEHRPGEVAQVDWADFGFAIPGCPRRVSAFVMTLCHSRMIYLEFALSQTQGTLLRCMERAVAFFGGTTNIDVFDNMRTVVLDPKGPSFHPRFVGYAARCGFAVTACRPRTPTQKGTVERGIGFVRARFWPGRRFASLLDLNAQAATWRDDFANGRVHDATGKVPALVFEHEEKKALRPVPSAPFDTDDVLGTGVTKTYRISFDRNRYSVPPHLHSQPVIVRGDERTVRIMLGAKAVAEHERSWSIGEDIELPEHRTAALAYKKSPHALPPGLEPLGEVGKKYLKLFAASSRSIQREIVRLVFLVEIFGASATLSGIEEVMRSGHVGAEYVEYVLRHKQRRLPAPAPLRLGVADLDRLSLNEPDLSVYDDLFKPRPTRDPGSSETSS
jgi:transposase